MLLRRLEEIDSLYCFFLGRRAETIRVLERHLFTSIYEAIPFFVSSLEFRERISLFSEQYARFSAQEWRGILELFSRSQVLASKASLQYISRQDIDDAHEPLKFLYWELLRRSPDDEGLKAHRGAIAMGVTLEDIVNAMLHSEEFKTRGSNICIVDGNSPEFESEINQHYIALVYRMVLNRPADATGMRHHLISLGERKIDRISFFEHIFTSVEAHALRRHRPGGESIVWREPVATLFRTSSIASVLEAVNVNLAQELALSLERLAESPDQLEEPSCEISMHDRGRPVMNNIFASSIYEALI